MADVAHAHDLHESTGVDNRKLGMWFFLSSEFLFFGALITNYLLFNGREITPGVPIPFEIYDIPFTSISSFILLMSSLTMVLAHHALHEGEQRTARTWLAATAGLGLVFLAGQYFEFTEFVGKGATLSADPVWSAFYLLTGFHGVHVLVGIIMLSVLFATSLRQGGLSEHHGMSLENVGLYWHFVDIIWIVLFTIVYLIP
ncbi:MAG: heme-copper oxidase subunit III [Acidimicrobiia bacterium]